MGTNIARGRVALPAAGDDDVVLRFDNNALAELEKTYGADWWLNLVTLLFQARENPDGQPAAEIPLNLLRLSLGKLAGTLSADDRKALLADLPLRDCYGPLLEALCAAVTGKTYEQLVADLAKRDAEILAQAEEAAKKGNDDPPSSSGPAEEPSASG